MFDDPKKELQRLEKRLLAAEDEDWLDQQLEEAKAMIGDDRRAGRPAADANIYRNYANNYGASMTWEEDDSALYVDEYEEEDYDPREKGIRGLIVLACLETLGIVAIIAYWAAHLL